MKYKLLIIATIGMLNAQVPTNIITEYNAPPPEIQNQEKSGITIQKQEPLNIQATPLDQNDTTIKTQESHSDSILNSFYGHAGFFGKTNILGKNKDSYGVFSASIGLTYNVQDMLFFNIGIYGMTPFMEYPNGITRDYVSSKFNTNNAYVKYITEGFFSVTVGRYHEERDWLKHYVQGAGIDIDYNWIKIWGNWVDEQAHANREHLTDFNIFKNTYNKQWLGAAGINLNMFGIDLEPYYYYMNNYFWSAGGKIGADIDIGKEWNSKTIVHYAYLDSKVDVSPDSHSNVNLQQADTSSLFWFEEAIKYQKNEDSVIFGAGFIKVWKSYFKLANLGNMSRFETHSDKDYDVIEPGGLDNGTNTSNMFNANTRTIYGFVGFKIKDFSMMILGRNSKGNGIIQDSYSLGGKWKIIDGINIGGVGVYMMENKRNMSFAKGYIEFAI